MNCMGLKELLEEFINKNCAESEYPTELDELLSDTAKTGVVRFSWHLLRPLLKFRLQSVLNSEVLTKCSEDDEELIKQLLKKLDAFDNPPFTIQRLCELVVAPKQHYKHRDKYMRALEKNLMVVSTQEPDLTWMKCPRLTQLLEEPTTEPLKRPNHTHDHTSNYSTALNGDADSAEHPTQSHSVGSPLQREREEDNLVHSSPETSGRTGDQEVPCPSVLGSGFSRKRSSSMRDALEQGGSGRGRRGSQDEEQEVMGPVLQEADSTTIEHSSSQVLEPGVCLEEGGVASASDSEVCGDDSGGGAGGEAKRATEQNEGLVDAGKSDAKRVKLNDTGGGVEGVAEEVKVQAGRVEGGVGSAREGIEGEAGCVKGIGENRKDEVSDSVDNQKVTVSDIHRDQEVGMAVNGDEKVGVAEGVGGGVAISDEGDDEKMDSCKEAATGQMESRMEGINKESVTEKMDTS